MALIRLSSHSTYHAARELERDAQIMRDRATALRRLKQEQRLENYARRQLDESIAIADRASETCLRVARDCRRSANG